MSRSPLSSLSRLPCALFSSALFSCALLLAVIGGLAGCGNKGPLFLPPPAVQQPEPAATAPTAPATTAEPTTTEPGAAAPPAATAPAGN